MEFLVSIEVRLPAELDAAVRTELLAAEWNRGRELRAAGVIRHLWRLPGRLANVGVWVVDDAAALHDAITSLPLWPWMTVAVEALASHPVMEEEHP